jgi:hypothetical protein
MMTVSELIEQLKTFPPSASVCVSDYDPDFKVPLFLDVATLERIVDSAGNVVALLSVEDC